MGGRWWRWGGGAANERTSTQQHDIVQPQRSGMSGSGCQRCVRRSNSSAERRSCSSWSPPATTTSPPSLHRSDGGGEGDDVPDDGTLLPALPLCRGSDGDGGGSVAAAKRMRGCDIAGSSTHRFDPSARAETVSSSRPVSS
eukprot:SAG25_NODE_113_length_14872_cov_23.149527_5_plen_141_part_00